MNPETLLVDAWLRAGNPNTNEIGCPGDAALVSLVARQLPEQEARRLTAHLASCARCRRAVAQLVSHRAVPTTAPVTLVDLLQRGEVTEAWRDWLRGLVHFLPDGEDEHGSAAPADYQELSPPCIDNRGRLIVDLAASQTVRAGTRVRIALTSDGAQLDLCEVSVRSGRVHAVIDLSPFQPRPGILRPGVLAAVAVQEPANIPAVMPILAALQDTVLSGTEFWDRFAPLAAHGDRLAAIIVHEMVGSATDQTTRAPRLRASSAIAGTQADKTPLGRVQYALNALEEYASMWKECNGKNLDGAAGLLVQLRAALSPFQDSPADRVSVPEASSSVEDETVRVTAVSRAAREAP